MIFNEAGKALNAEKFLVKLAKKLNPSGYNQMKIQDNRLKGKERIENAPKISSKPAKIEKRTNIVYLSEKELNTMKNYFSSTFKKVSASIKKISSDMVKNKKLDPGFFEMCNWEEDNLDLFDECINGENDYFMTYYERPVPEYEWPDSYGYLDMGVIGYDTFIGARNQKLNNDESFDVIQTYWGYVDELYKEFESICKQYKFISAKYDGDKDACNFYILLDVPGYINDLRK